MNTLLQAGARVQQAFERRSWRFCFIGGIANFRWGTPRLTNDLDLTLLTGFGGEQAYVEELLAEFESRIRDAATFAATNRVLLLRTCSAEDLIVHKAFAGRPQDWVDIEGVILKQRGQLAWPQIAAALRDLADLKGDYDLLGELERTAMRAEATIGPFLRG